MIIVTPSILAKIGSEAESICSNGNLLPVSVRSCGWDLAEAPPPVTRTRHRRRNPARALGHRLQACGRPGEGRCIQTGVFCWSTPVETSMWLHFGVMMNPPSVRATRPPPNHPPQRHTRARTSGRVAAERSASSHTRPDCTPIAIFTKSVCSLLVHDYVSPSDVLVIAAVTWTGAWTRGEAVL